MAISHCCVSVQFVVEDQKFALFNFVNDQNNEADVLKEQISQVGICFHLPFACPFLRVVQLASLTYISLLCGNLQIQAEIQHFTAKSLQNEKDHGSFLADIEEKQVKLQSQTENYDKQAVMIDNIMGSVKAGVGIFFPLSVF